MKQKCSQHEHPEWGTGQVPRLSPKSLLSLGRSRRSYRSYLLATTVLRICLFSSFYRWLMLGVRQSLGTVTALEVVFPMSYIVERR